MPDLLWLLLPVAAASGWLAARRGTGRRVRIRSPGPGPDYFRGLNFLVNEQPDKAIEVFVRLLEVDSDTVETHLALGNLFRRRGEVDRAIRIHQNLIARPTLSADQRNGALLELGQDYMRAGLLDRAEALFRELIDNDAHTAQALRHLLDIYQQEKEWDKAVQAARRLEMAGGEAMNRRIAQFHCEQAEQALSRGDHQDALRMARRALAQDKRCVRASLLLGRLAREAGDCKGAIRAWRRVEEQDIEFLPEVLPHIRRCHDTLGTPGAMIPYLREVLQRYDGVSPVLMLAELICEHEGEARAAEFMTGQLRRRPSVRGLGRLIELNLAGSSGAARDNLLILRGLVEQLLEDRPAYQCRHCGFSGKALHWQCPGCKEWNTIKPIHGVEGE